MTHPCPCCGYLQFDEQPGSHDICAICFWEDDAVQLRWPDWSGGANKPALKVAQRHFEQFGAVEERALSYVRQVIGDDVRDEGWRPIDGSVDFFEPLGEQLAAWPDDRTVLYWWRPTFWRPGWRQQT